MSIGANYPTREISADINQARQAFLASGNQIQQVPVMRRDVAPIFMIDYKTSERTAPAVKFRATAFTLARRESAKARAAAEAAEQKTYEGMPCKKGHTTKYTKSGDCCACRRARYEPRTSRAGRRYHKRSSAELLCAPHAQELETASD